MQTNQDLTVAHDQLQVAHKREAQEHEERVQEWQETEQGYRELRNQHALLVGGLESAMRQEVENTLAYKNAEIQRLRTQLAATRNEVKQLQKKMMESIRDEVVVARDDDYFDGACQRLCELVKKFVIRFSKFSDTRACRTTASLRDQQIALRFENAVLDGSDVDSYLGHRVKRRDVFMSVVMTMLWEFIFTRYVFGMDRGQRQKLKQLERELSDVGPLSAVMRWRAITVSLLTRRGGFAEQCAQDTDAVIQEIYHTLSTMLPPPREMQRTVQELLRSVVQMAVELSIEMRTQRAEYIMLPPLRPEYDETGQLARKIHFNAALMNERGDETTTNEELDRQKAVVRIVLFPLVVKRGADDRDGDNEVVVCPAQVLTAPRLRERPTVRMVGSEQSISTMDAGTII